MKVENTIGKGTEAERQECVKECVNNREILRWLLITLIRAERVGRNQIENLTMAYTNGIKVWMSISLSFYGYYGGPKESLWTPFSSLPLVRRVSFQKQILLFFFLQLIFSLFIYKILLSTGWLLMDELSKALSPFYPSSGGMNLGSSGQPPLPSPDGELWKMMVPAGAETTASPQPPISSGSDSWIDRLFSSQANTSASAAEAEKVVIPSPEISQGELLGDSPKEPAPPSTGVHFPSYAEIERELDDFLSAFSKIRARSDFVITVSEKLDLLHASPEKLEKLHQLMQEISQSQQKKPGSAGKAADLLHKRILAWENE